MNRTYILVLLLYPICLTGQPMISEYFTFGSNAVSEGLYFQNNTQVSYKLNKFTLGGGVQFTASHSDQQVLSGFFLRGAAELFSNRFPILVSLEYLRKPYSKLLSENNFCLTIERRWKHFELVLGNSVRVWSLSRRQLNQLGMANASDRSIVEYRNLLYRLTYNVKPRNSRWNLSFSLTDFDDFLIQRGTNPLISCALMKVITSDIELFSELWYQGAGMFNLQADYFGFYLKTGIRWQL